MNREEWFSPQKNTHVNAVVRFGSVRFSRRASRPRRGRQRSSPRTGSARTRGGVAARAPRAPGSSACRAPLARTSRSRSVWRSDETSRD